MKNTTHQPRSFALILPIPPAMNNLYVNIPGKGRGMTQKGKDWKTAAGHEVRKHWRGEPSKKAFCIDLDVYVKYMRDADSSTKVVLDSMQGIVYENDSQVEEIRLRRFKAAKGEEGWIDVTVTEK